MNLPATLSHPVISAVTPGVPRAFQLRSRHSLRSAATMTSVSRARRRRSRMGND